MTTFRTLESPTRCGVHDVTGKAGANDQGGRHETRQYRCFRRSADDRGDTPSRRETRRERTQPVNRKRHLVSGGGLDSDGGCHRDQGLCVVKLAEMSRGRSEHRQCRERGVSESLQWSLVWPVVLLVVVAVIQTAVVLQARATVTEAARAAVRVQALRGSHAGEAEATARDVAQTSKVTDVTVTVSTTDSLVRVDVEGRAAALFGAAVAVRGHAVAVEEGT